MVAELHEANLPAEVAIDHIAVLEQGLDVVGSEYGRACGGRNVTCNDAYPRRWGKELRNRRNSARTSSRDGWLSGVSFSAFSPRRPKRNGISP